MIPVYEKQGVTLYWSHSIFVLLGMPDNSVDSIVTDPPYGLSFMGKKWDYNVPSVQLWREALRVLKPGGHLLSFAGSRTYHRMAVNIEDAGFEVRDQIMWIYGSGFPKSLDIGKAIDKMAGAERNKIMVPTKKGNLPEQAGDIALGANGMTDISAPATPEAEQWDGWGTALKPAHEPICVARKPLIGTVAENVLRHGTGGLNIDSCRVGVPGDKSEHFGAIDKSECNLYEGGIKQRVPADNSKGRWPANVMLDPEAAAMLDQQSGDLTSGANPERRGSDKFRDCYGEFEGQEECSPARGMDSGGASRFFYCAKASKADRDEGLEGMPLVECGMMEDDNYPIKTIAGNVRETKRRNHHPTVKPTDLMQYLVRLVTPPGGTVLDPFMGSGSTGKGAMREGFNFIGCEREKEYLPISLARIKAPAQGSLLNA